MRIFLIILCMICLIVINCAYTPFTTINSRMAMENARIVAVLNFEQEGFMGGEKLGNFVADELTSALFLNKKAKVVDRSHVRTVMLKNEVSGALLEANDIQKLGQLLDSDFIILGKLTRMTGSTPIPEDDQKSKIQIVFRILAVRDGSVIGIVEYKDSCKAELQQSIKTMIWEMAEKVKIRG